LFPTALHWYEHSRVPRFARVRRKFGLFVPAVSNRKYFFLAPTKRVTDGALVGSINEAFHLHHDANRLLEPV